MSAVLSEILNENEIYYNNFALYKITAALKNTGTLEHLHQKYLAPVLAYDLMNNSDYTNFISIYLRYDGHIKKISEKMFVHRNTVHYKIKKIEEILECSLSDLETKMYMLLAITNYRINKNGS